MGPFFTWTGVLLKGLSSKDSMMEYLEHTGSSLFAIPPGVEKNGRWGETLFGS